MGDGAYGSGKARMAASRGGRNSGAGGMPAPFARLLARDEVIEAYLVPKILSPASPRPGTM